MESCGCRISDSLRIIYCPLHQRAELLRPLIKMIVEWDGGATTYVAILRLAYTVYKGILFGVPVIMIYDELDFFLGVSEFAFNFLQDWSPFSLVVHLCQFIHDTVWSNLADEFIYDEF